MVPTQISKPGQKGGDVRFSRAERDIAKHLKQRRDTFVTTFIDYYGTKKWPGLKSVRKGAKPSEIADTINQATKNEIVKLYSAHGAEKRFIPFVAIHEFEALLFSDIDVLSDGLKIKREKIERVLREYGGPEAVNNDPKTAPSKRLDEWARDGKFPKTTTGIKIARRIGIQRMREQCPLFNNWLTTLENMHS